VKQANPVSLVGRLRNGNCTLTVFCDLPPGFGETIELDFLGRQARFPKGPASIAVLARVPVLLFISFRKHGRNCIHTPGVIEAAPRPSESFQQAIKRVGQCMANTLQEYLLRFPEQWLYLSKLPSYYAVGEREIVT
jgi:predicted LPLAT superfamily acyltransferase